MHTAEFFIMQEISLNEEFIKKTETSKLHLFQDRKVVLSVHPTLLVF